MSKLPDQSLPWPIAWPGVVLIAERENCRLKAYRCPAGVLTCGWGETAGVGPDTEWTQQFADQRFCDSLAHFGAQVLAACTLRPTSLQLAALTSLAYNIGIGGFKKSTVLRQHNAGDHQAAARAFGLWNKAGGQVLSGLTARRAAEAAMYLSADEQTQPAPMPQAVDPESRPITGPIASTSAATAGLGVIGLLQALGEQVGAMKGALTTIKGVLAEALGVPPDWILPLLLIVLGGVALRYRYLQRAGGHA